MDEDGGRLAVTAAVFTGALILTGPLTFGLVYGAAAILASLVGVEALYASRVAVVAVGVPAVLMAAEVVTEITAMQLYGIGALQRGSRRQRLVRHLVLVLVVVAALVVLVAYLANFSQSTEGPSTLVGLALVAVALGWGIVRTVREFRRGYDDLA